MKILEFLKKINTITILVALLTFIIGWQLGHYDIQFQWQNYRPQVTAVNNKPPETKEIDFKLFWDTWDLVSKQYVDKKAIDPEKMYFGAIRGMVAALGDPYTVFLPPEAQKSTKEELGGSFEGVGIQLGYNKDRRIVVIAPLKDTPADRVGIIPGDLILKINEQETIDLSLPEAVSFIRGPKGTKVTLEIFREGESEPRLLSLERDTIVVKSVEFSEKQTQNGKKIAYIKLTRFGEKTNTEWMDAVSQTLGLGASAVILDVRNNPGGFLEGARFIASEFLEDGVVVIQENGQGEKLEYKVNRNGKLLKLPLIVLINKGSASASEIVAGAIQDHKRGKLVGDVSFGKGTIQEAQDLAQETGIHITTAKWLTPDGRWIHEIGLTPDEVIKLNNDDSATDEQLDKALEMLN